MQIILSSAGFPCQTGISILVDLIRDCPDLFVGGKNNVYSANASAPAVATS